MGFLCAKRTLLGKVYALWQSERGFKNRDEEMEREGTCSFTVSALLTSGNEVLGLQTVGTANISRTNAWILY